MCSNISWCVNRGEFSSRFGQLISMDDNELDPMSKQILKNRYINLVNAMEVSSKRSAFWYSTFNTFTTVGSIIVPGLISIQDRTYITRKIKSNHLKSEGWLFLELAGDYSNYDSHQDAFIHFCNQIEKIKTEQITEEYTFESSMSTSPSYTSSNVSQRRNNDNPTVTSVTL